MAFILKRGAFGETSPSEFISSLSDRGIIMFRNGVSALKVGAFREYLALPTVTGISASFDVTLFGLI